MRGAGVASALVHVSESKMNVTARSMRTLVPAVAATAAVLGVLLLLEGGDSTASPGVVRASSAGHTAEKGS